MDWRHFAKAVRVNDAMIKRRDDLRLLLGENYQKQIDVATRLIKVVMEQEGTQPLPTTMRLCKQAMENGNGNAVSVLVAACVDMLEDTTICSQ